LRDRRPQHLPRLSALRAHAGQSGRGRVAAGDGARAAGAARRREAPPQPVPRRLGRAAGRLKPAMAESMLSSPAARSAPRADEATARIESLSHEGAGVAHVDGKATFIDGALPGEHVRFRYRKRRARYDTGAVLEVLEPSPDRVTPPCRYFGVCGGCTLQHLAAPAQLAAKQQILAETLAHVGRVQPERWLPAIAGPDRGYRRRARLGARVVPKKGGVLVGFRERRRSYITSLHECLTLDPRLSALLAPLHALIGGLSRPDRLPQVEVSAGDTVLAAVFRHLEPLT